MSSTEIDTLQSTSSRILEEKQKIIKEKDQELRELFTLVSDLRRQNELFRKALSELEAEKVTLAQSYLTTSINIRSLLNNNNQQQQQQQSPQS